MSKSSDSSSVSKPKKPYDDFPLFPHASGRWAKKIRGKFHYFGKWRDMPADGWRVALDLYLEQRDDLHAGRLPGRNSHGFQIVDLANAFLDFKKARVKTGEILQRTLDDYFRTATRIVRVFGKHRLVEDLQAADFELLRADIAKTLNPVSMTSEITRARSIFKFGYEQSYLDKPVRFGASFDPPRKAVVRKTLRKSGVKAFSAQELCAIIDKAPSVTLKAMILIGANSGMGNHDIGMLTLTAVDLDSGWIDFPREKTATPRRFPMWPETIAAIRDSLKARPIPKPGHDDALFLTRKRERWAKENTRGVLSREFSKLLKAVGITRKGAGFYDLRRTFQTVGEEAGESATKFIMGHMDDSMSARYRQQISDERLRAVVNHVHDWLWPPDKTKAKSL